MKLMTKGLEKRFAQVGCQEMVKDPIVIAHFFNSTGAGHWYATEYYPEERMIFGYASIFGDHCDEWGYTSLDELEGTRNAKVVFDPCWTERPASEVIGKEKLIW